MGISVLLGSLLFFAAVAGEGAQAIPFEEVEIRQAEFTAGDVSLAGITLIARGRGPLPGAVIIHGSGESDRNNAWAATVARELSKRGVAVLLPDKRGSGRSGGDWRTASFEVLADDAIAGVRFLQRQDRVAAGSVGVIGLSQGGHVAPLAAARSTEIAFVISISASTVPIVEQVMDEVEKKAERAGLSAAQIDEVNALHRSAIHYARTGEGWDVYQKKLDEARRGSWAGRGIAEGFPDKPDHWVWSWARAVGDYDPLPYWQQIRVPAVLAYGARDTQIRVAKSVARMEEILTGPDERNTTILVFGDSGHALYAPNTHELRTDLLDFLRLWIRGL